MISMSVPAWMFRLQTRPASSAANGPTRWLTELAKRAPSCDTRGMYSFAMMEWGT